MFYPETLWFSDAGQGHDVTVTHRDRPFADPRECYRFAMAANIKAHLMGDGDLVLQYISPLRDVAIVSPDDIVIRECVKPEAEMGEPFLPNPDSSEGASRIRNTFQNPAYVVTDKDMRESCINLKELFVMAGSSLQLLAAGVVDQNGNPCDLRKLQ